MQLLITAHLSQSRSCEQWWTLCHFNSKAVLTAEKLDRIDWPLATLNSSTVIPGTDQHLTPSGYYNINSGLTCKSAHAQMQAGQDAALALIDVACN